MVNLPSLLHSTFNIKLKCFKEYQDLSKNFVSVSASECTLFFLRVMV